MGLTEKEIVLVTDCGSTTTKAILFEKTSDGWRSTVRGEAPTTVERPLADVTIGAVNAFREVEELWGRSMLKESAGSPLQIRESKTDPGIDIYLSTSSAGGGLQMIVLGVVGSISARLAERAALGGGAIVMDTISLDDGRETHEHIDKLRHLRPDIVLIAGGTDGGTRNHPVELAELLLQADPRPRFGETLKIPVIYAGNSEAAPDVRKILGERFQVVEVANLCPEIGREVVAPARDAIHEIFLSHVMSHAPGYAKLLSWSPKGILPTPVAFGQMISTISDRLNQSVLAVDIGGATTDVFSSLRREDGSYSLNRTVSANLGMSYSVANVLIEAGATAIRRWLPFSLDIAELEDILRNKMIRPTSIPQTYHELLIEQAVAREALRLSLLHHQKLLDNSGRQKGLEGIFQVKTVDGLERLRRVDLIIGSGGVLSHAPDRRQAALMLLDAFKPLGVTRLAVDSVFMLPHLGVLATLNPEAATEVLLRDCLIPLGTSVTVSNIPDRLERPVVRVECKSESFTVNAGEIRVLELGTEAQDVMLTPLQSRIDCGAGAGRQLRTTVTGGEVGLIIDARNRIDAARSFREFGLSV
jgi:uncharacterized protein (TIGR01319 family)